MLAPVTRQKHATRQNILLVREEDIKMLGHCKVKFKYTVAILHETAGEHGHLALSTKKTMKWRSKKAAQKLKYCMEKTYEVELKSPASASEENNKDLWLFCAMLEELQAIYKIWCLKPPCEKRQALNKEKGILREYSRIFSPCLPCTTPFSFIPRNYSTVFIFFIEFNKFLLQLR